MLPTVFFTMMDLGFLISIFGNCAARWVNASAQTVIPGLMGAGRTELAMSMFGHSYGTNISGTLKLHGKEVYLKTIKQAIEAGLAYVTEDRKGNGLILSNPIRVNTTLARMEKISNKGIIDFDKECKVAEDYKEALRTKTPSIEQNVGNLSGGNQQMENISSRDCISLFLREKIC